PGARRAPRRRTGRRGGDPGLRTGPHRPEAPRAPGRRGRMRRMERIVVVGGGLAAAHADEALREEGYWGPLTVVGNEPLLRFERAELSKAVLEGKGFQMLHDAARCAEHEVRVLTNSSADRLGLASRTVVLDDGQSLGYDALLLATGARPRVTSLPGVERAHVL